MTIVTFHRNDIKGRGIELLYWLDALGNDAWRNINLAGEEVSILEFKKEEDATAFKLTFTL